MKTFALFAAFLLTAAASSFAADHRIKVSDTEFTPRNVNAVAGDTITFVLVPGAMGHNLQSVTIPPGAEPWDSPLNAENPRFRIQVTVPGVYRHHCNIHLFMKGVIRVSEQTP
jgi:plastocyanin